MPCTAYHLLLSVSPHLLYVPPSFCLAGSRYCPRGIPPLAPLALTAATLVAEVDLPPILPPTLPPLAIWGPWLSKLALPPTLPPFEAWSAALCGWLGAGA
jgi:hypothetical protein